MFSDLRPCAHLLQSYRNLNICIIAPLQFVECSTSEHLAWQTVQVSREAGQIKTISKPDNKSHSRGHVISITSITIIVITIIITIITSTVVISIPKQPRFKVRSS